MAAKMKILQAIIGLLISLGLVGTVPIKSKSPRPEPIDKMLQKAMKKESNTMQALSLTRGNKLVELDMMLTEEQFKALHGANKEDYKLSRIALGDESYRWTGAVVPYAIDSVFTSYEVESIRRGMDEWEKYTCIQFIPRTNEENYLEIISADGCWATVGMDGGKQQASIEQGSCTQHHTIVHELGHVIGRHHEQTRPDRDEHVTVNLDSIRRDLRYNFDKYKWGYVRNYGVKYDYWSIMHYSQYAFSDDGQRTILTKDEDYQGVIGTVPGVSLKDIQTANLMYRCSEHCDRSKCPHTAILSEDCKCWCNTGNPGKPVVVWDGVSECKGADDALETCLDYHERCEEWGSEGECEANPNYMTMNCRKACKLCGPDAVCRDYQTKDCEYWSLIGECSRNTGWMLQNCMKSCGACENGNEPQPGPCDDVSNACKRVAENGGCQDNAASMLEKCPASCHVCPSDPEYKCQNWHFECNLWQESGECSKNEEWMSRHCPKACGTCSGTGLPDCRNYAKDTDCNTWADEGECVANRGWMLFNCAKSCKVCGNEAECIDRSPDCDEWKRDGYCTDEEDRHVMAVYCPVSCGRCQPTTPADDVCANYDAECSVWAGRGWCRSNPNIMLVNCPKACNICGPKPVCLDYNDECARWNREGECESNPYWMHVHCARSCRTCPKPTPGGGGSESCSDDPCHGGKCTQTNNGFTCSDCPVGYGGNTCEDNLCLPNPCSNMGICEPKQGGYTCKCRPGYTGSQCQNDVCMPSPCGSGGTCIRERNTYSCSCKTGFSGDSCEHDVCSPNPCNGGTCQRGTNGYTCNCPHGTSGFNCQDTTDACINNPCGSGGTCRREGNTYSCSCKTGFSGYNCEHDVCSPNPCNGGTCQRRTNDYTCNCPHGTSGFNCQDTTDNCFDKIDSYVCYESARQGRCETNPGVMLRDCPKSCRVCGPDAQCDDLNTGCEGWAKSGECTNNPTYMRHYCRKSCEVCKASTTTSTSPPPQPRICHHYDDSWCQQLIDDCDKRAARGECDSDPGRLLVNCPISCGICGPGSENRCKDYNETSCKAWAQENHCTNSKPFMEIFCRASCGCCGGLQ